MQREDKERVVAELADKLRGADTLIVADYRGLTMPQIDALRGQLLEHGAKFSVVKNTLTRRAAEEAGVTALLALLEGPSAIAFVESDGDMVAVAKAMADSARETRVLEIRGGILAGREISADEVEELSKLPPLEALRGQVLGAVIAPLTQLVGLVGAPLQSLVGLLDARIEQLGGEGAASVPEPTAGEPEAERQPDTETAEPAAEAEPEAPAEESEPDQEADDGGS